MNKRREYAARLIINDIFINKIIIDPHYEAKHADYMSDQLIIELVQSLHHKVAKLLSIKSEFIYCIADPVLYAGKPYRLILVFEKNESYVGVINAHRR